MLRVLFNDKINLAISSVMFLSGIVLSTGRLLEVWAKHEPVQIYLMSSAALMFSGYGNILVSVVRKEQGNSE